MKTGGAKYMFTGPIEHDPMMWIIGLAVLAILILILAKIGWPEL